VRAVKLSIRVRLIKEGFMVDCAFCLRFIYLRLSNKNYSEQLRLSLFQGMMFDNRLYSYFYWLNLFGIINCKSERRKFMYLYDKSLSSFWFSILNDMYCAIFWQFYFKIRKTIPFNEPIKKFIQSWQSLIVCANIHIG